MLHNFLFGYKFTISLSFIYGSERVLFFQEYNFIKSGVLMCGFECCDVLYLLIYFLTKRKKGKSCNFLSVLDNFSRS